MKTVDLMVGVVAKQSLREVVRDAVERGDDLDGLHLAPFRKKDWIAGKRIGSSRKFGEIGQIIEAVFKQLIALNSHQRIRQESLRVFAVQPQVPIFKDPADSDSDLALMLENEDSAPEEKPEATTTCPICEREVHSYNLLSGPSGKIIGCYMCRGEPVKF